MEKITHQMRREQWSKIISECLAGGQTKTAWCKQNGISDKAFFYWQKILRREAYELTNSANNTSELPAVSQPAAVPFVELKLKQTTSGSSVCNGFIPDAVIQTNGIHHLQMKCCNKEETHSKTVKKAPRQTCYSPPGL